MCWSLKLGRLIGFRSVQSAILIFCLSLYTHCHNVLMLVLMQAQQVAGFPLTVPHIKDKLSELIDKQQNAVKHEVCLCFNFLTLLLMFNLCTLWVINKNVPRLFLW